MNNNKFKTENFEDYEAERLTVKEMPESERPYEKCFKYGAQALSDAELLAVIIRSGSRKERSTELACRIINLSGVRGINSLYHLSLDSLMSLHGIGKVKAIQILCIAELSKRMAKAEAAGNVAFTGPASVAEYFMEDLRHLEHEETIAVFLDLKMKLIYDRMIFRGTASMSMFEPREILSEALKAGAVNLIMIHNHPTGDPRPSSADISSTVRLKNACEVVGIRLYDHIIIGDSRFVSLKEAGIV